jgi:hypothetical protein
MGVPQKGLNPQGFLHQHPHPRENLGGRESVERPKFARITEAERCLVSLFGSGCAGLGKIKASVRQAGCYNRNWFPSGRVTRRTNNSLDAGLYESSDKAFPKIIKLNLMRPAFVVARLA